MSYRADVAVIGAGVVGLAIASRLASSRCEVVLLEQHKQIGCETSSRNSEVIHAGIYYPSNSLKAELCVRGRQMLYAYCRDRHIQHQQCGKLIVATSEAENGILNELLRQAQRNGVTDLQWLSKREALALEPALNCHSAVLSPSTGIVDSHALMHALLGDLESAGGVIALNTPVVKLHTHGADIELSLADQERSTLRARHVINAAGLSAIRMAAAYDGFPIDKLPTLKLAKGNYFSLQGRAPFRHLIYPAPADGGLGIHLTLDQGGQARFGPDVEWIDAIDYQVDPSRAERFERAIRRYWPELPDNALAPAYAGIRPKLSCPDGIAADFMIQDAREHGINGLINLFGIESPGLTAALALADEIERRVLNKQVNSVS